MTYVLCRYELHHGVRISDSALVDAAVLSDRYIADRFLPDKAIDLIDEAAAKLKMEITSKPLRLDEIDRKVCSGLLCVSWLWVCMCLNVRMCACDLNGCKSLHVGMCTSVRVE